MTKVVLVLLLLSGLYGTARAQIPGSSSIQKGQSVATSVVPASDTEKGSLIAAIKSGDLARVLKLLANGASPDATDDDGALALCWAVRVNSPDIVRALLAKEAKVNQEESDGGTALQVAASAGRADLVKLLLAHGAEVNHKDNGGHTALLCAAFGAIIKTAPVWLAKSLFELDEDDEVLKMIGNDHFLAAQLLLRAGADVNAQAEDCGLTPLMATAMGGNVELAKVLLANHADVNIKGGQWNALKLAEQFGSPESIQKELENFHDDESKQAVLNWVHFTSAGRHEIAEILRKAGAR